MFGGLFTPRSQAPGQPQQQGTGLRGLLDPTVALPMAAALMGNQGNQQNFANAFAAGTPGLMQQAANRQTQLQKNQTLEFLRAKNPELAAAVEGGMPIGEAWRSYQEGLKAQQPKGPTDTMRNLQWRAEQAGLVPGTPEYADFIRGGGGSGGVTYSKTPVMGRDENGNFVLGTIGDDASFKKIDIPEGFTPSPGVQRVDLGTAWGILNREGDVISTIPKDLAGAERAKTFGKGQGEAEATYTSLSAKMPGLEKVVSQLDDLADKATYTIAGQAIDYGMRQTGMEPRDSAIARAEYTAIIDNQILPLLRDTFGAQFTQKEGETLRATLGDPDKSPAEKQALLKAFIEQKKRDVQALEGQLGISPANSGGAPSIGTVEDGYRFRGGNPADPNSWEKVQ